MRHPGQRRLSSDQTRTRSLLIGDIDGERLGLVGQQRINGRETVDILLAEQDRRTLTFDIAEIGPMLGITDQLSEFRSEEHTSELPSLMRISYAVFCLKKKNQNTELPNNI